MIPPSPEEIHAKLLLRGVHLNLTDSMRAVFHEKVSRLLRHEPRIIRVRIDVDHDTTHAKGLYTAKGHIEISGPDLIASESSPDAYKAVDVLIDKLDRLLRNRSRALKEKRKDDIRKVGEPEEV
ncbi:MAG: ribosome-associated translation inhibitor RaiA [Opitutaceae bacterium]|nr:ribosome-associated translation inhibitor RaiA [Opitutaceae bacterium]